MRTIRFAGVISGDLVKSSLREARRQAIMDGLRRAVKGSQGWLKTKGCRLYFSEFYRGDAFQCALTNPAYSLWTAVFIRTELIKLRTAGIKADARLGVGLGAVSDWDSRHITSSDGEAFRLSGKALDGLKSGKEKYRRLGILTSWPEDGRLLGVLASFLDALMQRWTPEQAAAMSYFLRDTNQDETSKILKVKQPAVQRRLQTAGHFAVKEALEIFFRSSGQRVINPQINNIRL